MRFTGDHVSLVFSSLPLPPLLLLSVPPPGDSLCFMFWLQTLSLKLFSSLAHRTLLVLSIFLKSGHDEIVTRGVGGVTVSRTI